MSKKRITKTGRPHFNRGNHLFLSKIKYKKQLHFAEIELRFGLSQSQPLKQIKKQGKGRCKKNINEIHLKDLQQITIGALSIQGRNKLYKMFQSICEIYQYKEISIDEIPDKFFSGPFELSFHLNQMNLKGMLIQKKLQAEELLYLALLCLWKSQQLSKPHLTIIQSNIDYILTGLHIGHYKVLQRLQRQMDFDKKGDTSKLKSCASQEIMMLESQEAVPKSLSSTQVEIVVKTQQVYNLISYEEKEQLRMEKKVEVGYEQVGHEEEQCNEMQEAQEQELFQERQDLQNVEKQNQQKEQVLVQVKLRNPKKYKNKMIKKEKKLKDKGKEKPKKKKLIKIPTTLQIEQNNKKLCRLLCNYICHSYYYAQTKVIQMENLKIMQSTSRIRQAIDKKI